VNKLEPVEKDIIQTSVELDVNKGVDEIHKEQNNIENLPLENIESEEVIHHSLEIEQEDEQEQSDITSQENRVLSESSGTDEEFKQEDENQEDNREIDENTTEDAFSEVSTFNTKEEGTDDIVTEVIEDDKQKDNAELSFDEIVSKILTKEIKTNKDFRRVIEGRWAFKIGKTDRDLIPAIKAGKMNDSEYDQELVKKNITKLLIKVN
jgi:hypothetical protein